MKYLFLLMGVRGAGKTTVLSKLSKQDDFIVLKTVTTRKKRDDDESFYKFKKEAEWEKLELAYEVQPGDKYGLEKNEFNKINFNKIGLSVFHPKYFSDIKNVKENFPDIEFITIGLDTIENPDEQKKRVNNDDTRFDTVEDFNNQVKDIRENCDVSIKGDVSTIISALKTIANVILNKGVLSDYDIEKLIHADTLLTGITSTNIKPASYDLRLGSNVWIYEDGEKKRISVLSGSNITLEIPPYSYVIVESDEQMKLPKFISARFDLKVSLFFKGIILSAAPQVEPGYRGIICSLLYNASNKSVSIKQGDHYATIEFITTSRVTKGYSDEHQNKYSITDHMNAEDITKEGSNLLTRIRKLEKWKLEQIIGAIAVLVFLGGVSWFNVQKYYEIKDLKKDVEVMYKDIINKAPSIGAFEDLKKSRARK